jgi:hypothetical protein
VACGEVGLGGELRQVAQLQRRLAEASRLGFVQAVVPASGPNVVDGLSVRRVNGVGAALVACGLVDTDRPATPGADRDGGRTRAAPPAGWPSRDERRPRAVSPT